ncbi:choice-of-anchor Y domain-containing protein [Phormidesmis priestleyi]
MTWISVTVSLALLMSATHSNAATLTLYDGSKNTSLSNQGWMSSVPGASQTVSAGATTLNTTANNALQAGYARTAPSAFTLDRTRGYTLGFNIRLLSETHNGSNDRAGFSVTALGNDKKGVELGFWTDTLKKTGSIWAQNDGATKPPRFTRGETTAFNPGKALTRYELSVLGNSYNLFANRNYQTPILTGILRDYSLEGLPYSTPNFLFFGDNTTSARASTSIARIDLTDAAIALPVTPRLVPVAARSAKSLAEDAEIEVNPPSIVVQTKIKGATEPVKEIPESAPYLGLIGIGGLLLTRRGLTVECAKTNR